MTIRGNTQTDFTANENWENVDEYWKLERSLNAWKSNLQYRTE